MFYVQLLHIQCVCMLCLREIIQNEYAVQTLMNYYFIHLKWAWILYILGKWKTYMSCGGIASRAGCININIWSHMQTSRRLSDSRNPGFIWNNSINYWLMALLHARMMMRCWWGGWLRHWRRPRIEISNRCVFVTCFWKHFLLSFGFRTKRHNQTENQLIEITFYSFSKSILFHEIINLIIYSIHNRSVFIENM